MSIATVCGWPSFYTLGSCTGTFYNTTTLPYIDNSCMMLVPVFHFAIIMIGYLLYNAGLLAAGPLNQRAYTTC
jgi:hypothetical protein